MAARSDAIASTVFRSALPSSSAAYDLELSSFASLEAQVAAIADDIAYDAHDIDDGLRAGLFGIDDLKAIPLMAAIDSRNRAHYPGLDESRRGAELVRELISHLIGAVVLEAHRRLEHEGRSADDVRNQSEALIAFPAEEAAGRSSDQGIPEDQDVPARAGDAGDAGCRTTRVRPFRALSERSAANARRMAAARKPARSERPSGHGGSAISSPE